VRDQTASQLLEPLKSSLIELLQTLIRTNTVAVPPLGNETPGQLVLRDFLQTQGLTPELYEVDILKTSKHPYARGDRQYAGRKNLFLRLVGTGRGKSLLLNGHMDTVPPGAASWTRDPWSGHLQAGRIYGLGSFDMKGGLVAQFAVACALHKAGIRLGGDLICESVVDEEWGGGGGTLASRLRGPGADACVISEGTQLEIYRATRGGSVVDLCVEAGDPDHYFSSSELVSPALHVGRLLQWIETWVDRRARVTATGAYANFSDPTPVQILALEANRISADVPLSIPHRATVRVYFQFLPDEDVPAVLQSIRNSLDAFAREDPFFRSYPVTWKPLYDPPLLGHELAEDHPWTKCLAQNLTASLGAPAIVTAAPYPCDAFLLQREFGIPTLLFGPRGAGAHNRDEFVDVESVFQTAEVLLASALDWCNG
jgi:acetylornithine deacetylase